MQPVERIIITIDRKVKNDGRRAFLRGMTPGVLREDLTELMDWAYALTIPDVRTFNPLNLVFFMLPSGAAAIGRLLFDLRAFRFDRSEQFFLHFLVVSADTFQAFDNNPVWIYEQVLSAGQLTAETLLKENAEFESNRTEVNQLEENRAVSDRELNEESKLSANELEMPILTLAPFELGCAQDRKEVDGLEPDLLDALAVVPGPRALAVLVQSVLESIVTCLEETDSTIHWIDGLFVLLPIQWRPELGFSVGLHFGGEHYLRLIGCKRSSKVFGPISAFPYIDLEAIQQNETKYDLFEGWPQLVELVLDRRCFTFFRKKLRDDYDSLTEESPDMAGVYGDSVAINMKGFEWLYQLKYLLETNAEILDEQRMRVDDAHPLLETELPYPERPRKEIEFEQPLVLIEGKQVLAPFQKLSARFPEQEKDLMRLDSLIGQLLKGSFFSREVLEKFWTEFRKDAPFDFLWAVREEYIHYIKAFLTCRETGHFDTAVNEDLAALEIIDLLIS